MKKPELIFVGVIIVVAAYFVFSYITRKKEFDHWDLVTSNAAIVYESNSVITTWNKVVSSNFWSSLSEIESVNHINKNLQLIDTLSGGNGQFFQVFNNHNAIISAHITSQQSYGLTYIIPLGNSGQTLFLNLLANLAKDKEVKQTQRVYQAQTIYELDINGVKLSYILFKNTLVFSKVPFLVEDVVRNIQDKFEHNFVRTSPALSGNPSFATDDGNLFINGSELPSLANSFLSIKNRLEATYEVAGSLFFDLTMSENGLFASGFAYDTGEPSLVSTFKDQEAVSFDLMGVIPKNAAIVEHFAAADLSKWYSSWVKLNASKKLDEVKGKQFVGFLKNELAQITLQSIDSDHLNKLFVAQVSDVAGVYNHLNKLAEQQAAITGDSLYIESYAGQELRLIDNEPILEEYFGFENFNSTYYLLMDNYLVIANTAETLRNWLLQVEKEYVWSKSVRMNLFFKNALTEANYTYVSNFEYSWNLQFDKLNKPLKKWVNSNAPTLKEFDLLAFQISNLDNRYYTNFYINYSPTPKDVLEQKVFDVSTIQLNAKVAFKPKVVKNHKNGEYELLVQDSLTNLMLIGNSGDILWEDSLGVKLVEDIYQIDFYNNNKLQYLLYSDSSLFIIDRKGMAVEGYPKQLDYKINKLYLIDYDRSKKYRLLISDNFGNLRMYNKGGKLLEGWSPNGFGSNFSDDIFHSRVRGKDRILIPLANGEVHLTNRRGEEANGFPIDMGVNITNDFFVQLGENFDDTKFTTISKDGLIIRFTMGGDMLSRNQLYKESDQSRFSLVKEIQGKGFVFTRNDLNRLAILSPNGDVLFEKDFIEGGNRAVQYCNFGADKELYVVRNNKEIYLYDKTGKQLNNDTLTSDYSISLVYFGSTNICQIYLTNNNTLEIKRIYL